ARAAAAIATAARAAEEAEDAADAAAYAAEEAAAAAAAEQVATEHAAALARNGARNGAGQNGAADNNGANGMPHNGYRPFPPGVPQPRAAFPTPGAPGQHAQPSGPHRLPASGLPASGLPASGLPASGPRPYPGPAAPPTDDMPAAEATAVIAVVPADATAVIAAVPAEGPAPTTDLGSMTVPGRAAGGRAARRRAQEAAEAIAREATRDPATVVLPVGEEPPEPAPTDHAADEPSPARKATGRKRFRLRETPPVVLVGTGVGALIVVAAVLASTVSTPQTPSPAAMQAPAATSAPAAQNPAPDAIPAVDPTSDKAVAYLGALRNAEITTSRSGQPETEAAAVICEQLGKGADENEVVAALPAILPTVTKKQSPDVVRFAKKFYC
ncbi:hypothetical protein ACFPFQ_42760, partial [Pseudonocardia sp. GCM10023141]